MWELFFTLLFEIFEKVAMSAEAIFARDGVFENGDLERSEGECHVATEENEEADTGKIGKGVPHGSQADDGVEGGLAQNNGGEKGGDVYKEDGLFGEFLVSVENGGDEDSKDEQRSKLGTEIVGIFAVVVAVVEAPEKGGCDGDFDVFPGGFVDGGKEPDGAMLAGEVVEKVGESASGGDNNDAEPHDEGVVHGYIIA